MTADSGKDHILAQELIEHLIEVLDGFRFSESMALTWINVINVGHIARFQRRDDFI